GKPMNKGSSAAEYDAGAQFVGIFAAFDFVGHDFEDFLHARLYNLSQYALLNLLGWTSGNTRHHNNLLFLDQRREGQAMLMLEFDGLLLEHTQSDADVVGHLLSGYGNHSRVADGTVVEDGDVGGAAADVDQNDASLFLFVVEYSIRRRQRL